ncbi:hypothetical protein AcW1_002029 [Taiwanofungus camphoratus]|nr:hypothetical protein AcW1_002029 [Antrodia cinnamomea]KAI0945921.1 hypothetical protein AcV7_010034 [Antrodia cinnamomea]
MPGEPATPVNGPATVDSEALAGASPELAVAVMPFEETRLSFPAREHAPTPSLLASARPFRTPIIPNAHIHTAHRARHRIQTARGTPRPPSARRNTISTHTGFWILAARSPAPPPAPERTCHICLRGTFPSDPRRHKYVVST